MGLVKCFGVCVYCGVRYSVALVMLVLNTGLFFKPHTYGTNSGLKYW